MKKTLVILSIILVTLVVGLFLSAEIFEEKIGKAFKASVNESITSEFHFEAFDLSMIRSFPFAAIRFNDLSILDTHKDTLLFAERALFKLDMLSIFQSQVELHAAEVKDGFIRISVDKKGNRNYDILQPTESEESLDLGIREAVIQNMHLSVNNANAQSEANLLAKDVVLKLDIKNEIQSNILGSVQSKNIKVGKNEYLNNKGLSINSNIVYDLENNELRVTDGEVGIEGILFYTNGQINFNSDHEIYDLILNNTNGSLEEIFKLLPENQVEEFKRISSSGDFNLTVFYKGKQSKNSTPELHADLSFERGRIVIPQLDIPLKAVSFSAKYLDKAHKGLSDASVQINGFKASMDGEKIAGKFSYNNFTNPSISLDATGKMPIQTLLNVLGVDAEHTEGNIDFRSLEINGRLSDLSNPINQSQTVSKAEVVLDNISVYLGGKEVLLREGNLSGESDYFELKELEVRTPESVFEFNGYLKRLVPFLFAEYQRPDLQFDLDVNSATCNVAEILEMYNNVSEHEIVTEQETRSSTGYFSAMNGDIDININRFEHEKIKGTDFKGRLSFSNNNVLIKGNSQGMKGRFDIEGILNRKGPKDKLEAKLSCENVDVNQFFDQTNNFGQQTLRAEHLKGRINAQLLINAVWNSDGTFDRQDLETYGSAQITNGELIDFKLMENFSSYIKAEDLEHIKFGSLENYFKIENEIIRIPAMFIQSNAVNLTLSGNHAFNNAIDYNIKVNAGQVLTNKLKKHDPLLRPIPARKRGFFNLYYAVKGTIDEPSYKTAKRQVKEDLENSESLKSEISLALARAFPGPAKFKINTSPTETLDKTSLLGIERGISEKSYAKE